MIHKLLMVIVLLLTFFLQSYIHIYNVSIDEGYEIFHSDDLKSTGIVGGLSSSTFLIFVQAAVLWITYSLNMNQYSKFIMDLLRSSVPLIKMKLNLITIKFQSTFFSFFVLSN
ncbi:hypothetical protein [Halalkalibacter krulwichiae]|uniref:Uncharacterized protein n=1 Tax=Halalkalibacter krulwichiae TaxID=199441 RepID=A0A1X9MGT8_9BACI|nr:hypothetical protein [Halalkalibacter krulwichiae]ARK31333.1 hypothetical protein BkAM31D_16555 [Halalkalibacter krulwichiae]